MTSPAGEHRKPLTPGGPERGPSPQARRRRRPCDTHQGPSNPAHPRAQPPLPTPTPAPYHERKMLDGFRALDLTGPEGQLCGRILGDLGADVIKIEPPEGDPSRRIAPFLGGAPEPRPQPLLARLQRQQAGRHPRHNHPRRPSAAPPARRHGGPDRRVAPARLPRQPGLRPGGTAGGASQPRDHLDHPIRADRPRFRARRRRPAAHGPRRAPQHLRRGRRPALPRPRGAVLLPGRRTGRRSLHHGALRRRAIRDAASASTCRCRKP